MGQFRASYSPLYALRWTGHCPNLWGKPETIVALIHVAWVKPEVAESLCLTPQQSRRDLYSVVVSVLFGQFNCPAVIRTPVIQIPGCSRHFPLKLSSQSPSSPSSYPSQSSLSSYNVTYGFSALRSFYFSNERWFLYAINTMEFLLGGPNFQVFRATSLPLQSEWPSG